MAEQPTPESILHLRSPAVGATGVECSVQPCGKEAHTTIRWAGPSNRVQVGHFCQEHARELWKMMDPLLKAGLGHWTNFLPGEIEIPRNG